MGIISVHHRWCTCDTSEDLSDMITIREVAREAGVSPSSAASVLRGRGKERRIASETQRRVEEAAARLGYQHNSLARSLGTGKSNLVGILGHSYPTYHTLQTREAARVFIESGFQITMQDLAWRPQQEAQLLQELLGLRVEGLYLESGAGTPNSPDAAFDLLHDQAKRGLPMVRLDIAKGLPVDVVTTDREQGAYLAAKHLLDMGHRHIAYLIDLDLQAAVVQARLKGLDRALIEHDLNRDAIAFLPPCVDNLMEWRDQHKAGYCSMQAVLALRPRATALLAVNDFVALGAMAAAADAGLSISDDLAVVGFTGYPEAELSSVPLTTVAYPFEAMAQQAACMLIERIGGLKSEPRTITLSPQLVVRRSCGANGGYQTPSQLMHNFEQLPVQPRSNTALVF